MDEDKIFLKLSVLFGNKAVLTKKGKNIKNV